MQSYGAIRKVMLIVLLSILGSYCIGSDHGDHAQGNVFESAMQSTYDIAASVGSYCYKLWSELADKIMSVFKKNDEQVVKIQLVDDSVHGNDAYCTDGAEDCRYLNHFFNDTYYKDVDGYGRTMDMDDSFHYDVDEPGMPIIEDHPDLVS